MEEQNLITHFVKSPDFKTHYVSGIFGGITVQGQISLMHFVERVPLPKSVSYNVKSNGATIETGRDTKTGIVRETQGGLLIDVEQAKSIIIWLQEKVSQIESQIVKP